MVGGRGLGRRRPWSVPARQSELSSRWLVCWWLLGVHGCKWPTDGLRELSLVAATLVGSVDGDVASWGERLTRISAEMADVKRIVVVVVVVVDSLHSVFFKCSQF